MWISSAIPTGRLILKREGYRIDLERILPRQPQAGVALEINSQVDRLDLDDTKARDAKEHGVKIVIDSDAHSTAGLGALRWGALTARRAWLEPADVLNTQPLDGVPCLAAAEPRHARPDSVPEHAWRRRSLSTPCPRRRATDRRDPRRDPGALLQDDEGDDPAATSTARSTC